MKIKRKKITYSMLMFLLVAGIFLANGPLNAFGQVETSSHSTMPKDDYILGPGDLVRVVVWKNSELTGEYRVRPDGKFSMPLIGDVLAEGSSTEVVSKQIAQKLKLFIDSPYVSAIIVEAASNKVYILGEVTNPGTYTITGPTTVLQALAMAGGFTEFANKEKMVLVRGIGEMQKNIPLSYSKILRTPGEENNPVLKRGDTLVVP